MSVVLCLMMDKGINGCTNLAPVFISVLFHKLNSSDTSQIHKNTVMFILRSAYNPILFTLDKNFNASSVYSRIAHLALLLIFSRPLLVSVKYDKF